MYSPSPLSRFGRHIPPVTSIFCRSSFGSRFKSNGHDPENTGLGNILEQSDQNTCENGTISQTRMENVDNPAKDSDIPLSEETENSYGSLGFEKNLNGFLDFKENRNACPGFKDSVNGFPGFEGSPSVFTDLEGEEKTGNEKIDDPSNGSNGNGYNDSSSSRVYGKLSLDANAIYEILQRDGPGFDVREALEQTEFRITVPLVRLVLTRISRSINSSTKARSAKLGFKFFVWAGQQEGYKHNPDTYNLLVKIFADCEELKAMWRLVEEMLASGCPTTARTFNILLCSCGQAGMPRKVVEKFIRSKNFNYRPYKHSFNSILHALLKDNQFKLIEWVYKHMLDEGHSPDTLTYNIIIYAKYKLGKLHQFHRLLEEMGKNGFAPDLHTYNILLHVLGKGDKPLAALNLLNYMIEAGCHPQVIHFTALIDGLSRAGNLDACEYFFEDMGKKGCQPDVVCYTVMITGFIMAGELKKAQTMFDEMIQKGQLPNVFTYNAMIQGLCGAGRYKEASGLLEVMESRGCNPNFVVYSTLIKKLRSARKFTEAQEIMDHMEKRGRYSHLMTKLKGYRR